MKKYYILLSALTLTLVGCSHSQPVEQPSSNVVKPAAIGSRPIIEGLTRRDVLETFSNDWKSASSNQEKTESITKALDSLEQTLVQAQDQEVHLDLVLQLSQAKQFLQQNQNTKGETIVTEILSSR